MPGLMQKKYRDEYILSCLVSHASMLHYASALLGMLVCMQPGGKTCLSPDLQDHL